MAAVEAVAEEEDVDLHEDPMTATARILRSKVGTIEVPHGLGNCIGCQKILALGAKHCCPARNNQVTRASLVSFFVKTYRADENGEMKYFTTPVRDALNPVLVAAVCNPTAYDGSINSLQAEGAHLYDGGFILATMKLSWCDRVEDAAMRNMLKFLMTNDEKASESASSGYLGAVWVTGLQADMKECMNCYANKWKNLLQEDY